ncbi:hypothetical protein [Sphingomonas bacterium]|uniref:hypothetical protein n=1 Tax=Sphingomonas bacterium TaxID=1895847 RepID=UPI001575ECA6|nr:hypothetical protein [Sphingomonas bacterium]
MGGMVANWSERVRGGDLVSPALADAVSKAISRFAAPVLSVAVLAGALWQFHAINWHTMLAMVPRRPIFWIAFVLAHLAPIVADWLIYRRLWNIPASGMLPLARKMIGNNLLFGYAGEAYLYAWAKGRGVCGAAFGAVKDVAILSAAVGNATTIVVTLIALPFMGAFGPSLPLWVLVPSLAIIAVPPLTALALRNKLFSRSGADLRYIAAVHGGRAAVSILMTGLLWQLALPAVALLTWVVLSALKLLVSRLPLISQKDVVFAGVSVALLGKGTDAAALIALMATLSIAADVMTGILASLAGVAGEAKRRAHAGELVAQLA